MTVEHLQKLIYQIRWVDGIKNAEMVTDKELAEKIIEAGYDIRH